MYKLQNQHNLLKIILGRCFLGLRPLFQSSIFIHIYPALVFQHFVPFTTDWARLKGELSALFIGIKHLLVINFFWKFTFKVM